MSEEGAFDIARKSVYWTIAGFVIVVLFLAFIFLMAGYKERLMHVPEKLQAEFISLRFTNIPECFAYQDPSSERIYPGVIDFSKFTQQQMKKCYPVPEDGGYKEIQFALELQNNEMKITSSDYYKNPSFKQTQEVLVKKGETYIRDTLIIKTQTAVFTPPQK